MRRLFAELTVLQRVGEGGRASAAGCEARGARFLLFTYADEQEINGFAAIFQFYAAALVLAHRYNRTLVELAPRVASSGGRQWREAVAANDPWHRAPARACGGTKMACFLPLPPAGCGVTVEAGDWRDVPLLDVAAEEALRSSAAAGHTLDDASGAASRAQVVRIDTIARFRSALLEVTAGAGAAVPRWWERDVAAEVAHWCTLAAAAKAASEGDAVNALLAAKMAMYCEGAERAEHATRSTARGTGEAPLVFGQAGLPRPSLAAQLWFPAFEAFLFGGSEGTEQLQVGARDERESGKAGPPSMAVRLGVHYRAGDSRGIAWRAQLEPDGYIDTGRAAVASVLPPGSDAVVHAFLATDDGPSRCRMTQLLLQEQSAAPGAPSTLRWSVNATRSPGLLIQQRSSWSDACSYFVEATTETCASVSGRRVAVPPQAAVTSVTPDGAATSPHGSVVHTESWIAAIERRHDLVGTAAPAAAKDTAGGGGITITRRTRLRAFRIAADAAAQRGDTAGSSAQTCPGAAGAAEAVQSLTAGVVSDITQLAASDVMVGTCLSQVSRTAFELAFARGAALAPLQCMDGAKLAAFSLPEAYTRRVPLQLHGVAAS